MPTALILLGVLAHPASAAPSPKAQMQKLLGKNKVVAAAIMEAKKFSGAKKCKWDFPKLQDPKEF